jgi:hypothetical protein
MCLVQVFTRRSPFNDIREALIDGRLSLLVSNEILLEYEEVVTNELGIRHWQALSAFIDTIAQFHGNVECVTRAFVLRLLRMIRTIINFAIARLQAPLISW